MRTAGHTLEQLAVRWFCSRETAWSIVFGAGGFLERGLMQQVGDRLVVTELGTRVSHEVGALEP